MHRYTRCAHKILQPKMNCKNAPALALAAARPRRRELLPALARPGRGVHGLVARGDRGAALAPPALLPGALRRLLGRVGRGVLLPRIGDLLLPSPLLRPAVIAAIVVVRGLALPPPRFLLRFLRVAVLLVAVVGEGGDGRDEAQRREQRGVVLGGGGVVAGCSPEADNLLVESKELGAEGSHLLVVLGDEHLLVAHEALALGHEVLEAVRRFGGHGCGCARARRLLQRGKEDTEKDNASVDLRATQQ